MGYKKLIRFEELKSFPNVLEFPQHIRGHWKDHFQNANPLGLELACGKGEYARGLAAMHPFRNYIGVDLKGNRIWVGAKKATDAGLNNVAFLRTKIDQLAMYFDPGEVHEIWITFPDPHLRISKARRRLTHPKFLRIYQQFLVPGAFIHLKTDSPTLYRFTKKIIVAYNCDLLSDSEDVYNASSLNEELKIKTHYESLDIAQSNRVHYLRFSLPDVLPGIEKDVELKEQLKHEESGSD